MRFLLASLVLAALLSGCADSRKSFLSYDTSLLTSDHQDAVAKAALMWNTVSGHHILSPGSGEVVFDYADHDEVCSDVSWRDCVVGNTIYLLTGYHGIENCESFWALQINTIIGHAFGHVMGLNNTDRKTSIMRVPLKLGCVEPDAIDISGALEFFN